MNRHPEEWLDLVDENDQVVEKKLRSEVYAQGLNNFRVVNAFVKNSKGELWIPRRSAHKSIFPLCLDISAAGHVSSGETYEEALHREVAEELNLDLTKIPYTLLGKVSPEQGFSAFEQVYEILTDEVPDYNKDDFIEYFWFTPAEFRKHYFSGEKVKGDLPLLIRKFYGANLI